MARNTVHFAIAEVLRKANRPMTAIEIFNDIVAGGLYEFKAKDPLGIVRTQLRRHSKGAPESPAVIFEQVDGQGFRLLRHSESNNAQTPRANS